MPLLFLFNPVIAERQHNWGLNDINRHLHLDRLMTNKFKHGSKVLNQKTVEETWERVRDDHEHLASLYQSICA
ncbi:hypothetical protein CVT26_004531 [Gymnopilus dilepis]|uniref:Uncharacterized protein n=1 Tax=Gymnopilus dilepis TaxID=231916 RepID=A0A409WET0_9AGAR|nr:hypothetical protein CVT26_004531 [Gymnopilus dilepis]